MRKFSTDEIMTLSTALDHYCADILPSEINRLFRDRDIKVNGKKTGDKKQTVTSLDEICVYEKRDKTFPIYTTVYEDDNILVADKEREVNSEGLYNHLKTKGDYRILHRLDRNTCGIMLFAKNTVTEKALLSAIKGRCLTKIYEAVLVGTPTPEKSTLKAYLTKNANTSTVKVYPNKASGAEEIITGYEVVKKGEELSYVKINLVTGKTHQIRAHMAFIGHPVLGDNKYGNEIANKTYGQKKQLLISKQTTINGTGTCLDGKTFVSNRSFEDVVR
ncbi:MAG: RluA family pseudouridine synthase [Clostridia bacterium]|nr:RluA family pseudouridine synthase [Clostridia bacterium]